MPNTYTQLHIQIIFAVKFRRALISNEWKQRLYEYITGIFQANEHKMIQINGMPDHLHILIGMRPHQALSAIVQNVKTETSKWINRQRLCKEKFAWQEGFGAFSYSKDALPNLIHYIQNQEAQHQQGSFLQEYKSLLTNFEIEWDQRFLFIEPADLS